MPKLMHPAHHIQEITDTTRFKRQLKTCFVSKGVPRLLDFLDLNLYPLLFF